MNEPSIRPTIAISGRQHHGAAIQVHIEFDDFDKAMEFNAMVVDWIVRELPREEAARPTPAAEGG